jgi:hypothetical protein
LSDKFFEKEFAKILIVELVEPGSVWHFRTSDSINSSFRETREFERKFINLKSI